MNDEIYMKRAIELAEKGDSRTQPNPLVGCVIVKDGRVVGEGYHSVRGGAHAEVEAINDAYKRGESIEGATVYVSLEPCSHFGKTPPCALRLVEEKVGRVVIAIEDPNPLVKGRGISILNEAGISTSIGVLENEAIELNKIFLHYIKTKMPYIILKSATSLDGKIATHTGESQWISSAESREHSHRLRSKVKAIGVGIGTVISDNPSLTARSEAVENVNPIPVVFDSKLRIPKDAELLKDARDRIIICTNEADGKDITRLGDKADIIVVKSKNGRIDLKEALMELGKREISSILIEGGGELNFSFAKSGLVNEYLFYIAPMIIGGSDSKSAFAGVGFDRLSDVEKLEYSFVERIGTDIMISARPIKSNK